MESITEPLRYGIIGCGIIAEVHASEMVKVPEAQLIAVCDSNPDQAARFSSQYGAAAYSDLDTFLARADLEAVCICTPSGLHVEQVIQAAKAGKHILCEKPMAIEMAGLSRMIEACREAGVQLATIFPRRMSPQAKYAKQLIEQGTLGRLSLCSAYVKIYRSQDYYDSAGWRGTWEMDGGGAMMNQGIHTVDMLQWLAGSVVSLQGKARNVLRNIEVEDTAITMLEYESGAMGVLEITTTAFKGKGQRIEIYGEKGSLIIEEDDIVQLEVEGQQIQLPVFPPFQVIPDGHREQIRDLCYAVREQREPIVSGKEGKHSLEIILGTYASSRQQKEIRVKEYFVVR
ncbi:Gfo/Idh/MocA family oxidoreductase [Paenibacillus sp. Marseille-Q4541]|uniref:Gfo/Idh/MocA family protein n=1 Tax=Paenibacillus sp. Marseille-Q4541 TaxID=2831522 RepID=UPI001BA61059|nr:Gfo/Idh/MocA family oxidoreductase [Paenibacillus sp. Marseille-Q4541]